MPQLRAVRQQSIFNLSPYCFLVVARIPGVVEDVRPLLPSRSGHLLRGRPAQPVGVSRLLMTYLIL